ncbi:MAG: hypothetical protein KF762_16740 [Acidobacteria bacterium]|nr:hypothetical protein [Acidobacteriota bacterium]
MNINGIDRSSERGGAGVKFLIVFVLLILAANAGYNYIPVAYSGANFRQEMDTAVVKGMATSGRLKPADVVSDYIRRAATDNDIPADAFVEVKDTGKFVQASASYTVDVNMLPFGIYKYKYQFEHTAVPSGFLTKQ